MKTLKPTVERTDCSSPSGARLEAIHGPPPNQKGAGANRQSRLFPVTGVVMFLNVKKATHVKDYVLRIEFTDGTLKDVDLRGELYGEIFEPLRDPGIFEQVKVNEETDTVEWPNGADFAPEFLHEIGKEVK